MELSAIAGNKAETGVTNKLVGVPGSSSPLCFFFFSVHTRFTNLDFCLWYDRLSSSNIVLQDCGRAFSCAT